MSWEAVKGFCRRHTQSAKEKYSKASKTEDPETEAAVVAMRKVDTIIRDVSFKVDSVHKCLHQAGVLLGEISRDLAQVDAGDDDAIPINGKQIEMLSSDYLKCELNLGTRFTEISTAMKKFANEANQVHALCNDMHDKKLEFDFFRNKVAGLHANRPADPARIPRNEERMSNWQRSYEEANSRLKQYCTKLLQKGSTVLAEGSATVLNETGVFFNECGKTSKALGHRGGPAGGPAAHAVANVTHHAVQQLQSRIPVANGEGVPPAAAAVAAAVASAHVPVEESARTFMTVQSCEPAKDQQQTAGEQEERGRRAQSPNANVRSNPPSSSRFGAGGGMSPHRGGMSPPRQRAGDDPFEGQGKEDPFAV